MGKNHRQWPSSRHRRPDRSARAAAATSPSPTRRPHRAGRDRGGPSTAAAIRNRCTAGRGALNLPTVPTGYTELDQALGADKPFNGKKVSIQTQWTGGEGEGFAAAIEDFASATGIAIQVDSIGSSHETVLKTRIEGGSPPDMAALAQPTGVLAYAAKGKVIDVATFMDTRKAQGRVPVDHRPDHGWQPHLEHPDQGRRQVDDLVPGQGLCGQGLRRSQDLGRARRPGRQDRGRRQPLRSASAPAAPARRRAGS